MNKVFIINKDDVDSQLQAIDGELTEIGQIVERRIPSQHQSARKPYYTADEFAWLCKKFQIARPEELIYDR